MELKAFSKSIRRTTKPSLFPHSSYISFVEWIIDSAPPYMVTPSSLGQNNYLVDWYRILFSKKTINDFSIVAKNHNDFFFYLHCFSHICCITKYRKKINVFQCITNGTLSSTLTEQSSSRTRDNESWCVFKYIAEKCFQF